jgi:hypothetical protein
MRKPNTPLKPATRLLITVKGVEILTTKKASQTMFTGDVHKAVWYATRQLEVEGADGYGGTFMGIETNVQVLH